MSSAQIDHNRFSRCLILFNRKSQHSPEPANDRHHSGKRKNKRRINDRDEPETSENVRDDNSPGKGRDLNGKKHKRKTHLDVHRSVRFGHIVQPPRVEPGQDSDGREEKTSRKAMKGSRIKSLVLGEKVENRETCRRDHEYDGEVNDHGVRVAPEHGEA